MTWQLSATGMGCGDRTARREQTQKTFVPDYGQVCRLNNAPQFKPLKAQGCEGFPKHWVTISSAYPMAASRSVHSSDSSEQTDALNIQRRWTAKSNAF